MVRSDNPTIALIKNKTSLTSARALISLAICEVCDFFNVGKNMNDVQVAMTADMIIEQYWYLKLEEIKYCFRRAMRTEKLFDRLDGNIILGWLQAYDNERTEEAVRISDQEAMQQANQITESPDAVTFEEYATSLRHRAVNGDKEAKERIADIEKMQKLPKPITKEQQHQEEVAFFAYSQEYLKRKKIKINYTTK